MSQTAKCTTQDSKYDVKVNIALKQH